MRSDGMQAMDEGFEALLAGVLEERGAVEAPRGLEQRLLARLMLVAEETHPCRDEAASWMGHPGSLETHVSKARHGAPGVSAVPTFGYAESVRTRRSRASVGTALLAHAAVLLVVLAVTVAHVGVTKPKYVTKVEQLIVPPPAMLRAKAMGGGGGHADLAPVTQGRLPKAAQEKIVPVNAPPMEAAKLQAEPAVVLQKDLKMSSTLPDLGMPNSTLHGVSLGNGAGTGMGGGNGSGVGMGSGGNVGGGVMHVGGSVKAPIVLVAPDPEYSEEARKAKFAGNVVVYLVVDDHGNPTHVHAVRGVGMGLDEKAVEAVEQYKFKPATQNGKPVPVEMYIDVGFQIF